MPGFETLDRLQKAVLWPYLRRSAEGEPVVGPPVPLMVKWTDQLQNVMDPKGNTITCDATAVVDRDVAIDSIMWLGSLQDLPGALMNQDPGTGFEPEGVPWASGLMQVKTMGRASDIKNRFTRRTVGMLRFKNQLPVIDAGT